MDILKQFQELIIHYALNSIKQVVLEELENSK